MARKVTRISAVGTRGDAKGKIFTAKPDRNGRYVLNAKTSSPGKGNTTNRAVNKVYVDNLTDAAKLLEQDTHLINVTASDGKRALREYRAVVIDYA